MTNISFLQDKAYIQQFVILISIFLLCYVASNLLGLLILLCSGFDISTLQHMGSTALTDKQLQVYKLVHLLAAIGIFIVPTLLFSWLKTGHRYAYLQLHKGISWQGVVLTTVIIAAAAPLMGYSLLVNQAMELPSFLSGMEEWMRTLEMQAAETTALFLQMDNIGALLFNILMIAVIPALGEELFFRGALQQLLQSWMQRPHRAIWVAAIIFSFFHFQFYGFLPRMLIGVFLGYLFYWSGNLWYPILAHFIHNGAQVLLIYLGYMEIPEGIESPESIPLMSVLIGTLVLIGAMYLYRQYFLVERRVSKVDGEI